MSQTFGHDYRAEIIADLHGQEVVQYFPRGGRCDSPLLVRFTPTCGSSWVGGFGGGTLAARVCTGVFPSPRSGVAVVVSQGRAYAVTVEDPGKTSVLIPELVTQAVADVPVRVLLLADPWRVHAFSGDAMKWSTGRLGIEGVRIIGADERCVLVRVENSDGDPEEHGIDVHTGQFLK